MQILESIASLRAGLRPLRALGKTLAFAPTMGNLHGGHLRLVEAARQQADAVIASIFVNPTQFGAGEDFGAYPRTPARDIAQLREAGADILFMPPVGEIYPSGASTFVETPGLSDMLCGHFRPGHFRGVATVVCKLFNLVQPDIAVFGEKDFQQLLVIRRMAADLNFPVQIIGVPTAREANGLAMSSRNGYLTAAEKSQAALLYQCLRAAGAALAAGRRDYAAIELEQGGKLAAAGFKLDYFAIRRSADLAEAGADERELVILAAARLGKARLIDNLQIHL